MVTIGGIQGGTPIEPILAECMTCGLPFVAGAMGPSGMQLGHGQDVYIGHMSTGPTGGVVSMQGVQVQCKRCGSMGRVPDGVYSFVKRGRQVLRQNSPQQTATMVAAIQRYQAGEADEAEVEAATPEAAKPLILEALKRADKKYWIGILLAVLFFLAQWHMSDDSTKAIENDVARAAHEQTEHDRQVEECVAAMMARIDAELDRPATSTSTSTSAPTAPTTASKRKPGRNEPCWCGSGSKFKRCHGAP
jgi:sirohydrochlorin ferrochelatase